MRSLLIILVLLASPLLVVAQSVMDMAGATNGTTLSGTNLNAASHCLPSGVSWGGSFTTTAYSNTHATPFSATKYCGGTGYPGSSTLAVAWDSTTGDHWSVTKSGNFGNKVSYGFAFYSTATTANFTLSDSSQISNSTGSESLTFALHVAAVGHMFIAIEMSGGATGGTKYFGYVPINENQWYWATCLWDNSSRRACAIYQLGSLTPLPDLGNNNTNGSGGSQYMSSIPVFDATDPVFSIGWGFQGSDGPGFNTTYFGNILFDFTGVQYPLLDGGYWAGLINDARVTDWTGAGVIGGIPSASWTQCGATISPPSSLAAINAAISACGTNQFVLLGPGTFSVAGTINLKSNMALRGSGSNSTFIVETTPGATIIGASGSTSFTTAVNWTAGYGKGSTSITLASIPGGVTANQSIAVLTQCEDGATGTPCVLATSTDNGGFFNCSVAWNATGPVGCSSAGPDGTQLFRWQQEMTLVTAISGNVITLKDPLMHPNWASGQSPQAQFITAPLHNLGVESLSVDATGLGSGSSLSSVSLKGVLNGWIYQVRAINSQCFCLGLAFAVHSTLDQNYCAFSQAGVNHSVAGDTNGHNLIQNNIFQGFQPSVHNERSDSGTVVAYNFDINQQNNTDLMEAALREHSNGSAYKLYEGNVASLLYHDDIHGSILAHTGFRNFFTGWESCANGQCGASVKDSQTFAIKLDGYARYHNYVANVLGTPSFHTTYSTTSGSNKNVFGVGISVPASGIPVDTVVATTLMRYGNWDNVTAAVRWCGNSGNTGWATTCASSQEIASSAPTFPSYEPTLGDTVAGQGPLPASLYLAAKPAWFQSIAWPPIGPDVSSGNIGQCSGSLNVNGQFNGVAALTNAQCGGHGITASAWGGHVNAIPAMNCALAVMGMPPDGTGSALAFDANLCYSSLIPIASFSPSSLNLGQVPVGLTSNTSQTVTLTNTGSANLVVTAVTPSSIYALVNNTCGTSFTLTPGSSCTFQVTAAPTSAVTFSGNVTFADNAGNPDVFSVTATGTGPPAPGVTIFAGNLLSSTFPFAEFPVWVVSALDNPTYQQSSHQYSKTYPEHVSSPFWQGIYHFCEGRRCTRPKSGAPSGRNLEDSQ